MFKYYFCSRIMPGTKYWEDLSKLLNIDLEGKQKTVTYISGCMRDQGS